MTNEERWAAFVRDLREYIQEHHHGPNKHSRMLNAIKYTRKKIKDGKLEEWKRLMFEEIAEMRDLRILVVEGKKKTPLVLQRQRSEKTLSGEVDYSRITASSVPSTALRMALFQSIFN